jgi:hypothetical protein
MRGEKKTSLLFSKLGKIRGIDRSGLFPANGLIEAVYNTAFLRERSRHARRAKIWVMKRGINR